MEKIFFKTSAVILFLSLFNCNQIIEKGNIIKSEKEISEVVDLFYQIRPLQDSISKIAEFRKNDKQILYGVSFDENELHYIFKLSMRDLYMVRNEFIMLKHNNMDLILSSSQFKPIKDTLNIDLAAKFYNEMGLISFNTQNDKLTHDPFIEYWVLKKNIDSVQVYEGY